MSRPSLSSLTGPNSATLLELDLSRGLTETAPAGPLVALQGNRTPRLADIVEKLRRAGDDDEVVGLIALVGGAELTMAQSDELRAVIAGFRAKGKPTLAWASTFGELVPAMAAYHLAVACDQVWLQPSGGVGINGFAAELAFAAEALDRLGVQTQVGARYEYKGAVETFTRSEISEPNREMTTRLLESATEQFCGAVADGRGLSSAEVRSMLGRAPFSPEEALEAGLIDAIGYRDEAYDEIKTRAGLPAGPDGSTDKDDGPETDLVYVERYGAGRIDALRRQAKRLPRRFGDRSQVAVVEAVGPIVEGRSRPSPFGGSSVGADPLTAVLREAGRGEHVKAVVLRVDSPGGSYVASDAIRREVVQLREEGIPVIASMASVAASGGYFISMGCDRIVANPGTITGSIGVFAGKPVIREALLRLGINRTTIALSPRADMFSTNVAFDDDEMAVLDRWLDSVYADFTAKAAGDRGLSIDEVDEVARGRVWTGVDAVERGLVDSLGGLSAAIDTACELAGLDRDDIELVHLPKSSPFDRFNPAENSEAVAAGAAVLSLGGPEIGAVRRVLELASAPPAGVLSLPMVALPGLLPKRF